MGTDFAIPVHSTAHKARTGMIIGALGVVFGDIGTSPIYTLQTLFNPGDPHPVPITRANVYGVVSLIFWSVMIIVTLTYVTLVMRADNNGEGGIMALITLLRRWTVARTRRTAADVPTSRRPHRTRHTRCHSVERTGRPRQP